MAIAPVIRAGIQLSCRATGPTDSGQAVLLIHGLNTNMAFWHPLIVRSLADQRLVLLYDQRGHGNSDMPDSGYTLAELAEDARAVLDAHGVEVADLIAHSFGSGVALQLARMYPQRVRSLTLLDGRLRTLQGEVRLRDWAHFDRWVQQFEAAGIAIDADWPIDCWLPLRMEGVDFSRVAAGLQADGFFVPRTNKRSGARYRRLLTETSAPDEYNQASGLTRESLSTIAQPTLLVYGSASPFLPTRDILAAELPDVQTVTLPGTGHNFPFTQPEQTLSALTRCQILETLTGWSGHPTK